MKNVLIFSLALFSVAILLTSTAYADVIPPNKQKKLGISNEKIGCDSGLFKVIRAHSDSVACVNPSSVSKLVDKGWAKSIDDSLLTKYLDLEKKSIGTINKISVIPIKSSDGNLKPKTPVVAYDYVFEVCSTQKIYNPTILIQSDSETKKIELAETITPEKCVFSVSRIKAASGDSIQATLLNKGEISKVISGLEDKLTSLKAELTETRITLSRAPAEGQDNSKQGNKIADIRKQINDTRAELHRLLFTMYTPSKTTALEKMSFSGKPIEGETATKLSTTRSLAEENRYIVTFEACAGKDTVRLPVVTIASDKQTVDVKLGTKISPNSCQMTTGKIIADNPETITVATVGNPNSNKVDQLEKKITELQQQLTIQKEMLRDLIHNSDRPVDFNEQADVLSGKVISLRDQVISAKAEFSKLMLETYR